MRAPWIAATLAAAGLAGLAAQDLVQRKRAIRRNFPVLGRARYAIERIGPELRQYIVASNNEERPFSRDQRSWIYASAKQENNYFGFGTDNDVEYTGGYPIIKQRTFARVAPPTRMDSHDAWLPSVKVLGGARGRRHAFRPDSVVNISGMSYGSLSANAVRAMNTGARLAGVLHDTGEGGLSAHHRHGGELIFQIGTGYFGCRDAAGKFDLARLKDLVASAPVRALEIKLSQGAKPGLGGMLPGVKVTPEIARIRGIEEGVDCASPSRHTAFGDVDSMLDFVELLAAETGLPVGIKTAVGHLTFFDELIEAQARGDRGIDFLTIDGGEGGTGAAPLIFADSVAFPFRVGFAKVWSRFAEAGLADDLIFIGSGKLGVPDNAIVAFALGADLINVGREAMLAVGCIQAQKCHTDHCPTGVATQNRWLAHGLDPHDKSIRVANYLGTLRRDLARVAEAVGVPHPALVSPDDVEIMDGASGSATVREVYGYRPGWNVPTPAAIAACEELLGPHR